MGKLNKLLTYKEFSEIFFVNFKAILGGNVFEWSKYFQNIINNLDNDDTPIVILHPGGKELSVAFLYYFTFFELYANLNGFDQDITDELSVGDLVMYDGKLSEFLGKKKKSEWFESMKNDNDVCYAIRFSDGINVLREENHYKLSKYNGSSTRLNKMEGKSKKKSNIIEKLIDNFNLNSSEVNTLIHESLLLLSNKDFIELIIKNTNINFINGIENPISKIAPITYYSNSENDTPYKGNLSKRNPVTKIVSNIEVAYDIILQQKDINTVILDFSNAKKIDVNIIENIIFRRGIKRKIVIIPFNKIQKIQGFLENENLRKIIINKRSMNKMLVDKDKYKNYMVKNQNILNLNFVQKDIGFNEINFDKSKLFTEIYSLLKNYSTSYELNENANNFLIYSYSLLKKMKNHINVPSYRNNELEIKLTNSLHRMYEIYREIKNTGFGHGFDLLLDEICEKSKILLKEVIKANAKFKFIENTIKYSNVNKIVFIVPTCRNVEYLNKYYKDKYKNKYIRFAMLNHLEEYHFCDEVYILGFKYDNEYKLFSINNSSKITIALYNNELNIIKRKYMKFLNIIDSSEEIEVHKIQDENNEVQVNEDYEVDSYLGSLVNKFTLNNQIDYYYNHDTKSDNNCKVKCEYFIDFEDYVGVFKSKYKVHKLNRDKEELDSVEMSKIEIHDELVFLADEFREGDFIEEIVNKMLGNEEFKLLYERDIQLSKLWIEELQKIKDENEYSYNELKNKFKNNGGDYSTATIINWLKSDYIVGAKDIKVYEIIARLTNSIQFKEIWNDVFIACNKIRKMHINLRSEIGRKIINSTFKKNTKDDDLLRYLDINFKNLIKVLEVNRIIIGNYEVTSNNANNIKGKDE